MRNTIVHDVAGDGIVLYQVEDGLIERSAAWLTGLQPRETIGTPNGIWTWRCRRCTVQFTEGFFTDSPGVDGGVYDIDWGNDDNVVQYNYAHDAQGYCVSVFAAGKETTTNSVVRHNVWYGGSRRPAWKYGERETSTPVGGSFANPALDALLRPPAGSPLARDGIGARTVDPGIAMPQPQPGRWTLKLFPAASPSDARSQLVFLEAAMALYGDTRLDAFVAGSFDAPLAQVRAVAAGRSRDGTLLALVSPSGKVVREWRAFAAPADLGLTLRHVLGPPRGCAPLQTGD